MKKLSVSQPLTTILLIAAFFSVSAADDTLISPDNPHINYYGRFDITAPTAPQFNWSGSIIEANLPGPIIGCALTDGNADYDVEIDGIPDTVFRTSNTKKYLFGSAFSENLHHVRIIQRSENHYYKATFGGFYLAKGKEPGAAPASPARKIEFIGDSYTAGYGIESSSRECDDNALRQYTNTNKTFASIVTKRFHAQSIILGWSGKGVVRNYNEPAKRSSNPYASCYGLTLGEAATLQWDFTRWIPDLVVICLGTNDYSTEPIPDDAMFTGDYHALIGRVAGNYPDAAILCLATSEAVIRNHVSSIVNKENTTFNRQQVFGAQFPDQLQLSACHWHPDIDDNKAIAEIVIDTVIKKLGWDTTNTTAVSSTGSSRSSFSLKGRFSVTGSGSGIIITTSGKISERAIFEIVTLRGQVVSRKAADANGTCLFPASIVKNGIYLVGNRRYGWKRVGFDPAKKNGH